MKRQRFLFSIVALGVLCASAFVAFGAFGSPTTTKAAAATPTATDFYLNGGSDPWGTAFDSSGQVWTAVPGCDPSPTCGNTTPPGRIDVYNPQTSSWVTSLKLPSGFGQALFIAFDKQGRAWFPMPMTNSLGMYNPSNSTFSQWVVPTANSGPWGVAIDSKGVVWFTEHYTNKIGAFDPSTNTFREIATPASNSQPYGITVDNSDNVWFTENSDAVGLIAEYTTGGVLNEYKIRSSPTSGLTPHLITIDKNGDIWWSEGWVSAVGVLRLAQATPGTNNGVTEYKYQQLCSNCGSHTSGISADSNGYVWFTDALQGIYGYLNVNGASPAFVAPTPSGGHPHDGIHVAPNGIVWFTEEFAEKLGYITGGPTGGGGSVTPTPTTVPTATPTPPPTGSTLAQDTFQRANQSFWGTASDGLTWGGDANSSSAFSVSGNTGLVTNATISSSAVLGPSITDAEDLLTGSIANFSGNNFGGVLRFTDGNNWYKAYIDGANLVLQKKVAGTASILTTVAFTASANTQYTIRFRVVGTTLSAKVWASSGSEPGGWMVTATDSSLASGQTGLRVLSSGAVTTFTSFLSTSLIGGGSVTPTPTTVPTATPTATTTATVTPTITATATTMPTVTATVPTGSSLGQDTFQRANQSFWGTASDGQTWGGDANASSAFSISANTGLVTNATISSSAVLGPSGINEQVLLTGSISSFSNNNFGGVLRFTDGNNWYKAYIDGGNLVLQKKVNGSATIITMTPFAASANTKYSLRFQVVGTTLSAKVWASSGSEPSGWMVTATDSGLASGQAGLRVLSAGATITIYSFSATAL
jgi:streptogramin lyase